MSVSPWLKFPIRGNVLLFRLSENIHREFDFRKRFIDTATRQLTIYHQKMHCLPVRTGGKAV